MRRTSIAIAVTAALGVFAGTTYAQQAGNSKKADQPDAGPGRRRRKTPPGQARKGPADRGPAQVPVTVHSNGVAVAELDEAFDEALVVRSIRMARARTWKCRDSIARLTKCTAHRRQPRQHLLEEK